MISSIFFRRCAPCVLALSVGSLGPVVFASIGPTATGEVSLQESPRDGHRRESRWKKVRSAFQAMDHEQLTQYGIKDNHATLAAMVPGRPGQHLWWRTNTTRSPIRGFNTMVEAPRRLSRRRHPQGACLHWEVWVLLLVVFDLDRIKLLRDSSTFWRQSESGATDSSRISRGQTRTAGFSLLRYSLRRRLASYEVAPRTAG